MILITDFIPEASDVKITIKQKVVEILFGSSMDLRCINKYFRMEEEFLKIMGYFQEKGIVSNLKKLPNCLLDPAEKV